MAKTYKISGTPFELPDPAAGFEQSEPGMLFMVALERANEFSAAQWAIKNDSHLSATGRDAKIKPLAEQVWRQVVRSLLGLENFAGHLSRVEAEMLAVGQPASPYDISRDSEIRAWWRGLSLDARLKLLAQIEADPEKHDAVVKAILRSPVPSDLGDAEARMLAELNERARRAERPDLAIKLDDGRSHLDAATRGMAHVRGLVQVATVWDGSAQLAFALAEFDRGGARALGFSGEAIVRYQAERAAKMAA